MNTLKSLLIIIMIFAAVGLVVTYVTTLAKADDLLLCNGEDTIIYEKNN